MYVISPLCQIRYIYCQVRNAYVTKITFLDLKKTAWESYKDYKVNLEATPCYIRVVQDVELAVDWIQQFIVYSYHRNCLVSGVHMLRRLPWWNKKLSSLRFHARRLFNRAKKTGEWDTYKKAPTHYNKQIRKAKSCHARGTARGSRMYQMGPGS